MLIARNLRSAVLIFCLLCPPALAQSGSTVLTPQEMRQAALVAQQQGQIDLVLGITEALLQRDAEDHAALILRARTLRDIGQTAEAARLARQAFATSETEAERYLAALVTAQALASDGRRTQAQLWLRRATEHAPDEAARRAAIRDFQYVRARNPLSLQFGFSVAPNSNINNGSTTGKSTFFDPFSQQFVDVELRGASLALSGLEAVTNAGLRWRFAETAQRATDLSLGWENRSYRLSSKARRLAPDAKAGDFATTSLYAGVTQRWRDASGRREVTLGGLAALTRYGGEAYGETLRLSAGLQQAMGPRDRLGLGLSVETTRGPRAPHAEALRLQASWDQGLEGGGRLVWQGGLARSRSEIDVADYSELSLGLIHAPRAGVFGADLAYGLRLRARDYDSSPFAPGARRDRSAEAHLSLSFRDLSYYGFHPVVTLRGERKTSNIGLYASDRVGVELGISSSF